MMPKQVLVSSDQRCTYTENLYKGQLAERTPYALHART